MERDKGFREALIVTLGSEPQIVTLTLYALENHRPPIKVDEVHIVHTSPSDTGVKNAIEVLKKALRGNEFGRYSVNFVPVMEGNSRVEDIESARDIAAFFRTVFKLIKGLKERGYRIHLNVSGGRKPMAVYSIVAAQVLFDEYDKAWYLISSRSLVESKNLRPRRENHWTKLLEIPVLPWSEVDPVLTMTAISEDLLSEPEFWRSLHRRKKRSLLTGFVYGKLSESERKVLFEVIRKGGSSADIARRLKKSQKTVECQLRNIYAKAKEWFNIPYETRLNREFLIREFRDFI